MIQTTPLAAFNDNYIWMLLSHEQQCCAVVDPGDAAPVRQWLAANPGWRLTDILITHHHADHTGGVQALQAETLCRVHGPALEAIEGIDHPLRDGQQIRILGEEWQVMHVPGHTRGHLAFFCENRGRPLLMCGDTLFAAGCGRVFEGTMQQMYHSLQKLGALPGETLVHAAHEYTLGNLAFALAVEPSNAVLQQRQQEVTLLRQQNQPSLPSRLAIERATNPFLRCGQDSVRASAEQQAGRALANGAEVFAVLRGWKDNF